MERGMLMKKIVTCILAFVLLLTALVALSACSSSKTGNPIDFGKKYLLSEDRYYVFESDQTGYCEYNYEYHDSYSSAYSYIQSGRVEFVWREASNGAVYLFRTETNYNEDHTAGKEIPLIDEPIYFSEEFFTYSYSNEFGTSSVHYIKEGSALEKTLED